MKAEQIKEKANELVYKHWKAYYTFCQKEALIHAIITVEHTINVLEEIRKNMEYIESIKPLLVQIKTQREILNELKSRI